MKYFLRIAFIICEKLRRNSKKKLYKHIFSLLLQRIIVARKTISAAQIFSELYNYIFDFLLDISKRLSSLLCCIFVFINNSTDGEISVHFIVNAQMFAKDEEVLCFLHFEIPKTFSEKCLSVFMLVVAHFSSDSHRHLFSYLFRSQKFANLL